MWTKGVWISGAVFRVSARVWRFSGFTLKILTRPFKDGWLWQARDLWLRNVLCVGCESSFRFKRLGRSHCVCNFIYILSLVRKETQNAFQLVCCRTAQVEGVAFLSDGIDWKFEARLSDTLLGPPLCKNQTQLVGEKLIEDVAGNSPLKLLCLPKSETNHSHMCSVIWPVYWHQSSLITDNWMSICEGYPLKTPHLCSSFYTWGLFLVCLMSLGLCLITELQKSFLPWHNQGFGQWHKLCELIRDIYK